MIKSGRKPSSDPNQEKLRQNKANWNKDVSAFVNDLIHLKKMMNGWPSKFYKERTRIVDPIPADPATIIGAMAGDFQELAQRGNAIVQEQINYAKTRKQKQPKQLNLPLQTQQQQPQQAPQPEQPKPDLTNQLTLPNVAAVELELIALGAELEDKYLISEGSNPITRFFTRILTPTMGTSEAARVRQYRMSLLDACVKTYKQLGKFQLEIVKQSKNSVHSSNKLLHETWNDWSLVNSGFSTYVMNMPKQVPNAGGNIPTSEQLKQELANEQERIDQVAESIKPTPNPDAKLPGDYDYSPPGGEPLQDLPVKQTPQKSVPVEETSPLVNKKVMSLAIQAMNDYKSIIRRRSLLDPDNNVYDWKGFHAAVERFIMNRYDAQRAQDVLSHWGSALGAFNQKWGVQASTLKGLTDIIALRQKINPPSNVVNAPVSAPPVPEETSPDTEKTAQLEVVAQAFLKKWVGKKLHQMSLFDKTSTYRIDIFQMATKSRKLINKIMDLLEKGMDVEQLKPLVNEVNAEMSAMRRVMRAMHMSLPPEKKVPAKKGR